MDESNPQESPGFCPGCDRDTTFVAHGPYLRNTLKCAKCNSVPRHRALMQVLSELFPRWRELQIHESSPGWDIVAQRLARECKGYTASHYDTSVDFGTQVEAASLPCKSYRSDNLEMQTFASGMFDIVVTFMMIRLGDASRGLSGDLLEVLVGYKLPQVSV